MYTLSQDADESGGLFMAGWVVDAVAIENHKIIVDVFYLLQEWMEDIWSLMQIIENNGRERFRFCVGHGEGFVQGVE